MQEVQITGVKMRIENSDWVRAKEDLVRSIKSLGFREDLGEAVARTLGSPKAMERMTASLHNVRPQKEELIVDEMLAICSEIADWREKKAAREANARYNEILNFGFDQ